MNIQILQFMQNLKYILKRYAIMASILFLITFTTCFIVVESISKDQYESESAFIVSIMDKDANGNDVFVWYASKMMIETVSNLAKSSAVLIKTIEDENLSMSEKALSDRLTVNYDVGSLIISMSYRGNSKEESKRILSSHLKNLEEICNDKELLLLNDVLIIIETPEEGELIEKSIWKRLLFFFVISSIVAGVYIVLKKLLDRKFLTKSDYIHNFQNYPIGYFSYSHIMRENKDIKKVLNNIANYNEYEKLYQLIQYSNTNNYKTIQFTSSMSGEGKSTVAVNFALSLVNIGKKVLFIDLDLRKPTIHRTLDLIKEQGIANYLYDDISLEETIQKYDNKLDVITCGGPIVNPLSIVESKKFNNLLDLLKEKYDYIILDTPPVLITTETSIIASYSDCVVFQIAANQTKRTQVKDALKQLANSQGNVVCINATKI